MQVELTHEQVKFIVDLVRSRIREIHPEIRRSSVYTVRDELQKDLKQLQDLLALLLEKQKDEELEAWKGYAETRKVPSNPPPGRGPE